MITTPLPKLEQIGEQANCKQVTGLIFENPKRNINEAIKYE